ncbi:hypothetical protein CHX23_20310 [Rhodococcoides fascians]|nr:hypothetical protein CHX23_20310 [Rhodococcus fascians]
MMVGFDDSGVGHETGSLRVGFETLCGDSPPHSSQLPTHDFMIRAYEIENIVSKGRIPGSPGGLRGPHRPSRQ